MSIRTTVSLDEELLQKVREDARQRNVSFKDNLNELVLTGLFYREKKSASAPYRVVGTPMGRLPGINYDDIGTLLDLAEGEQRR